MGRLVGGGRVVDGGSLAPRDGRVSSKNEIPLVCFLFHTRSSRTNQLLHAYQVYCCTYCCTAVLLYVIEVWSLGGCRVHCVVRGGWVGHSVRGSIFSSCGRRTLFFVSTIPAPHWCLGVPSPLLHSSVLYYCTYCCTAVLLPC